MTHSYKSISSSSHAIHRVLGSKHLAFAFPVKTEGEIKQHLEKLKKEYHDASHICFAWRLGWEKKLFRHSDAGEPSGTAGRPIFGQIQSFDLTDVLIAVARYFGGTKLGTGGLINAYKTAAQMAIESATIIELEVKELWTISFPYPLMGTIMKTIKGNGLEKISMTQSDPCILEVLVPLSGAMEIKKKLADFTGIVVRSNR